MGTRNRTAVVVIVAATGVAWSLALAAREPDATPVARKADRDAPLARKGDYLIPRVMSPPDLAARWVPLAPAVKVNGGLPNEGLPSIEGPSSPPPDPPSSVASKPVRAEATPHHRAEATPHHRAPVHHDRDLCAAQGMRREDTYQDNHWRSWRCVS
jgi:hypothetical protein